MLWSALFSAVDNFKIHKHSSFVINFQIENPEISSKLAPPKFSDFLKDFAKKDLYFAQNVHDKLTELVKLAKEVSLTWLERFLARFLFPA